MANFKDLDGSIKREYRTLGEENVVESFYIPCLEKADKYYRTTGYFSSSLLIYISKGLCSMLERKGKIKLVCSTELDEEDYKAIKKGYELKQILSEKLEKDFVEPTELDDKDRLNLLSQLISLGLLEIKIAVINNDKGIGIFHEKVGVMFDDSGNTIAFSGSSNDTYSGFNANYESFDVFCSWKSDESYNRCYDKEVSFNRIWNGKEHNVLTFDLPTVIREKILSYEDKSRDVSKLDEKTVTKIKKLVNLSYPSADYDKLHDYQRDAINSWVEHNYQGIFDMATGTGKTFTAAGAICKLFDNKQKAFVIVCCPFIHLVDQWKEELEKFNIKAIACYGNRKDYEKELNRKVEQFNIGRIKFACILITNSSFGMEEFQNIIDKNLKDTLLVVDEAHNFGAEKLSKTLKKDYPYRLALSATFDRYGDDEGTKKLYEFFGEKCITYTLEQAIAGGFLTKYRYYPVLVNLTENEYGKYIKLSEKISKLISMEDAKKISEASDNLKMLLLKRARIIAGANNKIALLKNIMKNYRNDNNILIYCGAIKYGEFNDEELEEDKKQIIMVVRMLNTDPDLKIKASKFTAEEDKDMRQLLKDSFVGKQIQALVAIKCLDEGMNIPGIKTAIIMASTTNPKEYIQRRGRVLRNSPGKKEAIIYDFVTIPYSINECSSRSIDKRDQNLVKRELKRVDEFATLANNPQDSNQIIDDLKNSFKLNVIYAEAEEDELL